MGLLMPRPGRLPTPQFAWLEITGFCNLSCRHCSADSSTNIRYASFGRYVHALFAGPAEERVDVPTLGRERVVSVLRR